MSRPLFALHGVLPLTPRENRRKIDLAFETKPLPPLERQDAFFVADVLAWCVVAFLLIVALWLAVAS